jgi:hypothetical protein
VNAPDSRWWACCRSSPIDDVSLNKLTDEILAAAIDVHRELGPGLLESI